MFFLWNKITSHLIKSNLIKPAGLPERRGQCKDLYTTPLPFVRTKIWKSWTQFVNLILVSIKLFLWKRFILSRILLGMGLRRVQFWGQCDKIQADCIFHKKTNFKGFAILGVVSDWPDLGKRDLADCCLADNQYTSDTLFFTKIVRRHRLKA